MTIFTPKNIGTRNYLDRVRFLLIWRLSISFCIALFVLSIVFLILQESEAVFTYLISFGVVLGGFIFLYLTHNFRMVYFLFAIAGTVIVHADINTILESPHYGNFLWGIIVLILTFFGLGKFWGVVFLFINSLGYLYYIFFGMANHYASLNEISSTAKIAVASESMFCLFLIGYLVNNYMKIHSRAEYELIEKNMKLEGQNEIIQKRDAEKTILVKEIHHRVKNNLQIIISLLRLQMSELKSAEAKAHFSEAINRVMVMASIHQKLYQEKEITEFNLDNYIRELSEELKSFFKEDFPIEFEIDIDYPHIDLKTVVPVGLILNELLSNSLKYAFTEMTSGKIKIQIKEIGQHFELKYSDNGKWKDPDADSGGFGIELIDVLTEQLNGTHEVRTSDKGTSYYFSLNKLSE